MVKLNVYHGSQTNNITLSDRPIYLMSDKKGAEQYAQGYSFGYDLQESDRPTIYTMELTLNNPKYIQNEDDYYDFMEITNWSGGSGEPELREKLKDYDGFIYECNDTTYYMAIVANKSCKVLDTEELEFTPRLYPLNMI